MVYILDTHVLLWWFQDPARIEKNARNIIENTEHIVYVSSVTTWEIVIKRALGKLTIPKTFFSLVQQEGFTELPISIAHTTALAALPRHHQDPFDRLLIAQASSENATLISRDAMMHRYPIEIIKP
jgi:PIN domain nuclease of toxin-antitoxin system